MSGAQAAGSRPSPGLLQSLQTSAQRMAHVYLALAYGGQGCDDFC